jgi:hypothetical protein
MQVAAVSKVAVHHAEHGSGRPVLVPQRLGRVERSN